MRIVDVSRRPFLNLRPIRRVAIGLWILGGVLLAANVLLYASYLSGSARIRAQLADIDEEIAREERALAEASSLASRVDIEPKNDQSRFLNLQIARRAFPWSRLFEDLEQVLPLDVWLHNVQPDVELEQEDSGPSRRTTSQRRRFSRRGRSGSSARAQPTGPPPVARPGQTSGTVGLSFQGTAITEEALLDFVDRLFEHPAFGRPLLNQESLESRSSNLAFTLDVTYFTEERSEAESRLGGEGESAAEAGSATTSPSGSGEPPPEAAPGSDATFDRGEDQSPGPASPSVTGEPRSISDGTAAPEAAPPRDASATSAEETRRPSSGATGEPPTTRRGSSTTPPPRVPVAGSATSTPPRAAPPTRRPPTRRSVPPRRPTRSDTERRTPTETEPPVSRPRDASSTASFVAPETLLEGLFDGRTTR